MEYHHHFLHSFHLFLFCDTGTIPYLLHSALFLLLESLLGISTSAFCILRLFCRLFLVCTISLEYHLFCTIILHFILGWYLF